MQYFSPLSILNFEGLSEITPKDLRLAKHKMMAEFELNGTSTIQAGGKELTRNDVLKIFDLLEQTTDLSFHVIVASDPVLLHFLERHELQPGKQFGLIDEKISPEFIEWISPYFRDAFNQAVVYNFRNQFNNEFLTLVSGPKWMTDNDAWAAWSGLEHYLHLLIRKLEENNTQKYHYSGEASKLTSFQITEMLKVLPTERFSSIINKYAFELMQFAILVFNANMREWAMQMMQYAKSLPVDEDTLLALVAKEKEMRDILSRKEKVENKQSNSNTWVIVRIAFILIYVISRFATCNSLHS